MIDRYSLKAVFSILALASAAAYVRNDEQLMAWRSLMSVKPGQLSITFEIEIRQKNLIQTDKNYINRFRWEMI